MWLSSTWELPGGKAVGTWLDAVGTWLDAVGMSLDTVGMSLDAVGTWLVGCCQLRWWPEVSGYF
jgi:hypothetical protein